MTIRQRLLIWMVGSITIVYVLVLGFEFSHLRQTATDQADRRYREALKWRAGALADELDAVARAAGDTAESVALAATPGRAALTLAERMLTRFSIINAVELTYTGAGSEGQHRLDRGAGESPPRLLPAAAGLRPSVWTSAKPPQGLRQAIWLTPIIDQDGVTAQALAEVPAQAFADRLRTPIVERSLLLLLDDRGRYLWHYDPDVMASDADIFSFARDMDRPSIAEAARTALSGEAGKTRMPRGFISPEPYLIYFHPVGDTGWTLVTAVPENELLAPVYRQVTRSAVIMIVGLVLIVAAVWFTAGRLTAPIERISEAARRLGRGMDYQRATRRAPRELRVLDDVLEATSAQLNQLTASQLEETARREFAEGELRVARDVQESLLPEPLDDATLAPFGLDLDGHNVPASGVAGDFFDYLVDVRGRLVICIADVSGKGARAAMLMAVARTALRTAADASDGPGDLVAAVNELLLNTTHDIDGSFISMQVLMIEANGSMTYANAGHPHAALLSIDGAVSCIAPPTGTIVGAFEDPRLQARTRTLELDANWQALVLVTDGVLEATKPPDGHATGGQASDRELFEVQGLHAVLSRNNASSAKGLTAAIIDAVRAFEGENQTDDITVVSIVRRGNDANQRVSN